MHRVVEFALINALMRVSNAAGVSATVNTPYFEVHLISLFDSFECDKVKQLYLELMKEMGRYADVVQVVINPFSSFVLFVHLHTQSAQ